MNLGPDPESKSGPKWPGSGTRLWPTSDRIWILSFLLNLFEFCCLGSLKKKVEKAEAKAMVQMDKKYLKIRLLVIL
jgi:hypothetical protein